MTPSLEGWPTKAKEATSPHEGWLALLDTSIIQYPDSWHIQNQKHIQNPSIFTILVYSEHQYPGIFRMLSYSKPKAYPEHCQTSVEKCFVKLVNNHNYFRKLFLQYKLAAFFTSWNNTLRQLLQTLLFYVKKAMACEGPRNMSFWYSYWYIQINSPICS